MDQHRIFRKSCIILTTMFFFLLLKANFGATEDKAVMVSKVIDSEDYLFISLFNEDEAGKNGFADGEYLFKLKEEYLVDILSSNQTHQDETATISSKNSANSQSQDVDLSSAHKYLGYGTAALQSDKNTHAVVGGVSTAMMILPIFVVHW